MRTNIVATIIVCAGVLAGCGQNTGFLIKPVPLDEQLRETTVAADRGVFIRDKIAVVNVDGLILNDRRTGLLRTDENPVSLFVEQLDKAQADGDVCAIIVRINSPGGGVTASDIMHRRLVRLRETRHIPVIAVFEDVAASGAYYIACGADTIIAHPTTITGSIGVIVQTVSFAGAMGKLGIDAKAVTSGQFKDMLNPLKPLDERDAKIVQEMVNDYYGRFLSVVAAGRPKLSAEKIKTLADGRVYTGKQAVDNGLVDALGYMDDAIALAKAKSGAKAVKIVMYHRPLGYRANAYSTANASADAPTQINLLNISAPDLLWPSQPQFLYLWAATR